MIPSHAPPPTSKRKGAQEGNPLEQAVKKAKKEVRSLILVSRLELTDGYL